jgi:hypothetical protein
MLGSAGSVQTVPSALVGGGVALRGGVLLPWRTLLAAALLALAVGVALDGGLGRGGAPVAPAAVRAHGLSRKGLSSLPLTAQGPVSAAMGADSPAYRVSNTEVVSGHASSFGMGVALSEEGDTALIGAPNSGPLSSPNQGAAWMFYNPSSTVSSVSPASGPVSGGTHIRITGTGFVTGATVEIGQGNGAGPTAIPASKVVVISPTEITATTGGSAKAGYWNLFVIDPRGTSPVNSGDGYTYADVIVSSVSPASGTVNGGTPIRITGTGFVTGAKVEIGQGNGAGPTAIAASNVVVVSPTEITATTGGSAKAGTWNLFVIDSGGTSPANTGDDYTFYAPAWLAPVTLSTSGSEEPQIAADAKGEAVAVWSYNVGSDESVVQGAVRSAGGNWQPNVTISTGCARERFPQVTEDAEGDAFAVWECLPSVGPSGLRPSTIEGAVKTAGGVWQPPVTLSETGEKLYSHEPQVAVDPQGDAVAVWFTEDLSTKKVFVEGATRPTGGGWGSSVKLSAEAGLEYKQGSETETDQEYLEPRVAVSSQGEAVAVWRLLVSGKYVVQNALRPLGGPWQVATTLSSAGEIAEDPHVSVDAKGEAVAIWVGQHEAGIDANKTIQSAARQPGGSWQQPVDLSAEQVDSPHPSPEIAVNLKGEAVGIWDTPAGSKFIVQAATKPSGGAWQAAVDLTSEPEAIRPQIAIDPQGDATAVWELYNGLSLVQAATRPAGGIWQSPVDLATEEEYSYTPQVAMDPKGEAFAIWEDHTEPSVSSKYAIQAAVD